MLERRLCNAGQPNCSLFDPDPDPDPELKLSFLISLSPRQFHPSAPHRDAALTQAQPAAIAVHRDTYPILWNLAMPRTPQCPVS